MSIKSIACPACGKSDTIDCHKDVVAVSKVIGVKGDRIYLAPGQSHFGGDNPRLSCQCGAEFVIPKGMSLTDPDASDPENLISITN